MGEAGSSTGVRQGTDTSAGWLGEPLTPTVTASVPIGSGTVPTPKFSTEKCTGMATAGACVDPFQIRATI